MLMPREFKNLSALMAATFPSLDMETASALSGSSHLGTNRKSPEVKPKAMRPTSNA
jgi:hypothetical protein